MKGDYGAMNFKRMLWPVVMPVIGCIVLAGAAYGLNRLYLSWNRLSMNMTMSGSNISPSKSMEPYKVSLRYQLPEPKVGESPSLLQWELDVPRAYLLDENGTNGSVYVPGRGADTQYALTLRIRADESLTKFTPDTLSAEGRNGVRDTLLIFSNFPSSLNDNHIVEGDLCVRQADQLTGCTAQDYRCPIDFQVDGWVVRAQVTKDLYLRPLDTCSMGKRFLNQFTIKRDNARILTGAVP